MYSPRNQRAFRRVAVSLPRRPLSSSPRLADLAFNPRRYSWFLLLSSCVGFYRVKRWESAIRVASLPAEPLTSEQRRHDEQVRRNIEAAFGFGDLGDEDEPPRREDSENPQGRAEHTARMTEAELRLTWTLQAAGLL
ncbi:hypothetical protein BV20DRAFT_454821 [Pilatotrama ljubarskyi]|nr:hypothetical protein BV20DRAFT_454821 [Pilatotrama ljubarskyi]